jgi:large-conductance mechanosensitive channel
VASPKPSFYIEVFMGLENVIKLAVTIVMAAALTGQLPRLTNEIRLAQIKILRESQASRWGSPDVLYIKSH